MASSAKSLSGRFQFRKVGSYQLDRQIGLETRHVRRRHQALEVHEELRISPLKFRKSRGQPKCPGSLGNRNFHFAGYVGRCRFLCPYQTKRRRFHAAAGVKHLLALRREPDSIDVAGDQSGPKLLLKVGNPSSQGAGRHRHMIGGRADAAAPHHLDELPDALPIRHTACRRGSFPRAPLEAHPWSPARAYNLSLER